MHTDETLQNWLALILAPGLSALKRRELLLTAGSISAIRQLHPTLARSLKIKPDTLTALHNPDQAAISRSVRWLEQAACQLLTLDHPSYPKLLARIPDAPVALFCQGDVERLHLPTMAIVGSRGASKGGVDFAASLAAEFSKSGLTVASGLALGIDTAAHRGALHGPGSTAAVMATGMDLIYPKQNQTLAQELLAQGGVIVSEMPLTTPPLPALFPQRNRIISGLSLGVVVVEASLQSGSLVTARMAGEQGREVFAVPGSVHNPMARGCHSLIRQGAKLIESAEDVLSELSSLLHAAAIDMRQPRQFHVGRTPAAAQETTSEMPELTQEDQRLLDAMGFDPIAIDRLVERTGDSISMLSSTLLRLELDGFVEALSGARYQRIR
jgi:DNA processing protein